MNDLNKNEKVEEDFPAETEAHWREFFSRFNNKVYPLFKENGISKDTALLAYMIGDTHDAILDLTDVIEEKFNPSTGTDSAEGGFGG